MYPLKSPSSSPMKKKSLLGTALTISSKSSQNYFLTSSLKPTYGVYALMMFKIKSSIINFIMVIISSCCITTITSFLRLLLNKMPTLFLFCLFPAYHGLNLVFSTSLSFWPVYLVSWAHKIFTRLLITVSTNSLNLSVKDPTFQLPK
jgi:hypothetical protein